jgi:asparagine synthase (glutamine-hydrolysing)
LFRDAEKHTQAAWTLLFYALWHRAHIEARSACADIFDALR